MKILLVEDNPADIVLAKEAIKRNDMVCGIDVVETGEEALSYLKNCVENEGTNLPSIVFLDLKLPGKSGIEVLREIRSDDDLKKLPVAIISGGDEPAEIKKAKSMKIVSYLSKPPNQEKMNSLLDSLYRLGDSISVMNEELICDKTSYQTANSGQKTKLLIVEDNKVEAKAVQAAIETEAPGKFEFYVCHTLEQALSTLRRIEFDVIGLDLHLPDAVRLSALAQIRELAREVPIVIITSSKDPALALEAITFGAQDFVIKGSASYGNLLVRVLMHAIERKKFEKMSLQSLEIEHRVLNEILQHSCLYIVRIDNEKNILSVNEAFASAAQTSAAELLNMKLQDLLPELNQLQISDAIAENSSFKIDEFKINRIFNQSKNDFFAEVCFLPLQGLLSGRTEYVLLLTDITEKVKAKMQRDEFIAALAHDLKNPLVGEQQVLTGILTGAENILPEPYYGSLLSLRRSNQSLLLMLSNMLEVYNLEREDRKLCLEKVNIIRIINEVLDNFKFFVESAKMKIERKGFPKSFTASVDSIAFNRIVSNLLQNAVKFGKAGSTITLEFSCRENHFVFSIENQGPQIGDEEKSIIFTRFKRSLPGKKYLHSSGLGLYLCKRLVEEHEGEIGCESDGEKSIFFVKFPHRQ